MPEPKRPALGANPLSQGIFSKTAQSEPHGPSEQAVPAEAGMGVCNIQEPSFLNPESKDREAVTLRLPTEINDWLDELLKQGKRKHGRKIPKEVWVQAALELLQAAPTDWATIASEDELRKALQKLHSSFKNQ